MKYYEVDQNYKLSNKKGKGDQFLDWFNDKTNVSMKVMGGIRCRAFRDKYLPTFGMPSLIVLFETLTNKGSIDNPWKLANFDIISGRLIYPGDAKKNSKGMKINDFTGNKVFLKCNDAVVEGNEKLIPPIIFFQTFAEGWSQFKGLFKFIKIKNYIEDETGIKNYEYHLQKINLDKVSVNWLRDRALTRTISSLDMTAPKEWKYRDKIIQFDDLKAAN